MRKIGYKDRCKKKHCSNAKKYAKLLERLSEMDSHSLCPESRKKHMKDTQ